MAIVQSRRAEFSIHSEDDRYRYKALKVERERSGSIPKHTDLSTTASAPAGCAGASTSSGETGPFRPRVIATGYGVLSLAAEEGRRPGWMKDIALGFSWCPGNPAILRRGREDRRSQAYPDPFPRLENGCVRREYPTFRASASARAFLEQGRAMGFHIMPHCNSIDMDPTHPVYAEIRDFEYRDLEKRRHLGWSWLDGRVLGVPESNKDRTAHRDKKVMVKIHPGLAQLAIYPGRELSGSAARDLALESVFLDVTLTTFNLHNSLVENTTSTEGMKRLIDEISSWKRARGRRRGQKRNHRARAHVRAGAPVPQLA